MLCEAMQRFHCLLSVDHFFFVDGNGQLDANGKLVSMKLW